ncbi:helix-turn-helix transcriptional regulator [Nocardioides ganghwensis]|uniref:DNA-binding protein n=1 Tax=Nocardioides ganghwensis TaxID=252230 RepID=A0A4V1RMP8_9ACTN|nr:helix-turn-helix domain-containing protein [Nocardioides ganghwensis]MBD3946344.1 helix-turn-helix domain-containing protein [Nocardioides ganghwensis]RYC03107.1 DNA-binding protein [Nocardioides ganghwensis]
MDAAPNANHLLSPQDLAALIAVPVATVYRWRSAGSGPRGYRIGKHVRFRMSDVEAWLDACADQPA